MSVLGVHDHEASAGCAVNGARIVTAKLADGDLMRLGRPRSGSSA